MKRKSRKSHRHNGQVAPLIRVRQSVFESLDRRLLLVGDIAEFDSSLQGPFNSHRIQDAAAWFTQQPHTNSTDRSSAVLTATSPLTVKKLQVELRNEQAELDSSTKPDLWRRTSALVGEGEGTGAGPNTQLLISTVDQDAHEPHVFYCTNTPNNGTIRIALTQGTWGGGTITVGLSGSAKPGQDYEFSSGQISGSSFAFFLPAISAVGQFHEIELVAANDGVEPGFKDGNQDTEAALETAVITAQGTYITGTASVNINDLKEKSNLETPFATAREMPTALLPPTPMSEPDGTFGQFDLKPEIGYTN